MYKLLIAIFFFSIAHSFAGFKSNISSSFGLVSVNLTESESTLEQTDEDIPEGEDQAVSSVSLSTVSLDLVYEKPQTEKYSYLFKAVVPVVTTEGAGVFMGGVGFNWYFNGLSAAYTVNISGSEVSLDPGLRYYAGTMLGLGYLVYNTVSAKKSDVFFDLGLHGGLVYSFGKKWGIKAEAGVARGTGVATSNINVKTFAGLSYNL